MRYSAQHAKIYANCYSLITIIQLLRGPSWLFKSTKFWIFFERISVIWENWCSFLNFSCQMSFAESWVQASLKSFLTDHNLSWADMKCCLLYDLKSIVSRVLQFWREEVCCAKNFKTTYAIWLPKVPCIWPLMDFNTTKNNRSLINMISHCWECVQLHTY